MSYWNRYPEYVTVAQKKAQAAKALKQLQKQRPGLNPVVLGGSALARTWWGKSWNNNLERYADYHNRIGRGRNYVRHGAVLDLQIGAGTVTALVQGSASRPYEVKIGIKAIGAAHWAAIRKQCDGRLKSLQDLLAGRFPQELNELFFREGTGLFPQPKEISFGCSCPDWASMCKHVAAALYGIGTRLDQDPSLFFTLRGVETGDLVAGAIQDKTAELLAKAARRSARVIEDADLSALFGLELDSPPSAPDHEKSKTSLQKVPGQKAAVKKPRESSRKTPVALIDQVAALIARSKAAGVDADTLAEKTGLPKTRIYALAQRLRQQGKIKNTRGVYVKASGKN
jgi:uncharacterized Zn finger protein